MCFTAFASFTSSGVIFFMGALGFLVNTSFYHLRVAPLIAVRKLIDIRVDAFQSSAFCADALYWGPLLFTPILFAVQQFCEGFVWVGLTQDKSTIAAAYTYPFFAYCWWPFWVPLVCLVLESRKLRSSDFSANDRKWLLARIMILCALLLMGALLLSYMVSSLALNRIASVHESSGHVEYHFSLLPLKHTSSLRVTIPYLLCTVVPFSVVRSVAWLWTLSVAVGASAIASYTMYSAGTFPSTWCFFCAWLSLMVIAVRLLDSRIFYNEVDDFFKP